MRSYRASSVFSNYSAPKRKKRPRKKKRTTTVTKRLLNSLIDVSSNDDSVIAVNEDNADSDEEILKLRLQALKSKQEVKELISDESTEQPAKNQQQDEDVAINMLRIQALRSAVIKKAEERKRKKLEDNERPYSPSQDLESIPLGDSMAISPIGSPFYDEEEDHPIDMDISNSPLNEEKELSDMDICTKHESDNYEEEEDEVEDELALRSALLSSMKSKTTETLPTEKQHEIEQSGFIAMNLKMAVERLKHKSKSGKKTIAEVLESNRQRERKERPEEVMVIDDSEQTSEEIRIPPEEQMVAPPPQKTVMFIVPPVTAKPIEPLVELNNSFSTITDTKNIPIIKTKLKDSRLVTSLDTVLRPVARLVITAFGADSSSEDEVSKRKPKSPVKKTARRIVRLPANAKAKAKTSPAATHEFEKNLDNYLKTIRMQQEKTVEPIVAQSSTSSAPTTQTSAAVVVAAPSAKPSVSVYHSAIDLLLVYFLSACCTSSAGRSSRV